MRHDPLYTSWIISCGSEEEVRQVQRALRDIVKPDATLFDVVRAFPAGTEARSIEPHRLGDYFASVRLLPGPPGASSAFRMLFHRRPDAGRYWKDFMVKMLDAARRAAPNVTTTLEYRGDELPETAGMLG
jgi:hypothetical protein